MRFIIRHVGKALAGGMRVAAGDALEALTHVRAMIDRGLTDILIEDLEGNRYEVSELERLAGQPAIPP